jgi:hypothetical protein
MRRVRVYGVAHFALWSSRRWLAPACDLVTSGTPFADCERVLLAHREHRSH